MKRIVLASLIVLLAVAGAWANGNGEEQVEVEVAEGYKSATVADAVNVQWKADGDMLHLRIGAATTGWVSVGFEPSSAMKDANILIGYVKDGTAYVRDDFGTGRVQHGADTDNGGESNVSNVSGTEEDGTTILTFTIPLDSGDDLDKKLVPGQTYKIIAAYGPNGKDDYGSYHAGRGSGEIEL